MARPRVNMEIGLGQMIQIAILVGGGLIMWGRGASRAATQHG